ncbi:MAG: ribose 5-phosphate isomerase B [Bacteroidota bacterium]|nr:ribose 5-phosphate isomerase B [Bacteroidota bacterium]
MNTIIAIGSDHAGSQLKEYLLKELKIKGYNLKNFGTDSEESVDYPDIIHPLASAVDKGEISRGIIMCGTGNGVSMVANKYPNVRAALCWNEDITRLARQHNDANILALPARFISKELALSLVEIFLSTPFEGGRHERRIQKISKKL